MRNLVSIPRRFRERNKPREAARITSALLNRDDGNDIDVDYDYSSMFKYKHKHVHSSFHSLLAAFTELRGKTRRGKNKMKRNNNKAGTNKTATSTGSGITVNLVDDSSNEVSNNPHPTPHYRDDCPLSCNCTCVQEDEGASDEEANDPVRDRMLQKVTKYAEKVAHDRIQSSNKVKGMGCICLTLVGGLCDNRTRRRYTRPGEPPGTSSGR